MKTIFKDPNTYNRFIILLLVLLGITINVLLPYKLIKIDSEFNFTTLFFAQNEVISQDNKTELEQIIKTEYFDKHKLFLENFSIFLNLAGSNVGFLFFLLFKFLSLYLVFKYIFINSNDSNTKDNKVTLIGIIIILNSAPFILISSNYLLDIISITLFLYYLIQKNKFNSKINTIENFDKGYKNVIIFSLKSTILFSILIYINPVNLVLIPFFFISSNIKNQKHLFIFGFSLLILWIVIFQLFGYSLLYTFDILPKLLSLKFPNTFILKNYLGILVFTLVFFYLLIKHKWKSEIFGNKNIEFYLIFVLLFILPLISQYFVSLYIYLLLFMIILSNILNVISYVFSSEIENQNVIINFLIFYFIINLYLVSNFY